MMTPEEVEEEFGGCNSRGMLL